ncbi:MAG TPA: hypothetical protein VLU25_04715, partial [Acidobacteriota bacterium]|nr:hypothetical protein [Acidobacteriota bacterium]
MSRESFARVGVFLLGILLAAACVETRRPQYPEAVRLKAEQPPKAFDQPDAAREYYAAQRTGTDGQPVDVLAQYQRARLHMRSMPRHSLRLGRSLPSLQEADLSPRA